MKTIKFGWMRGKKLVSGLSVKFFFLSNFVLVSKNTQTVNSHTWTQSDKAISTLDLHKHPIPLFDFSPSHQHSPGSATQDTVHRGRRWHTPKSRRSVAYCHTTCTPWPGWCSWHSWCAESRASYRDEHPDSVDSLSNGTNGERARDKSLDVGWEVIYWRIKFRGSPFLAHSFFLTSRFFTDQAVGGGRAGVGFKTSHLCPLQVCTEAWVAGLSRQPSQAGVGEWWRVLPAPVGYIDLPQANPGR